MFTKLLLKAQPVGVAGRNSVCWDLGHVQHSLQARCSSKCFTYVNSANRLVFGPRKYLYGVVRTRTELVQANSPQEG